MSYKCPVCSKAGLPDYRRQKTVCPQCDSDLSQYYLLKAITHRKPRKFIFASVSVLTLILTLYFALVTRFNNTKAHLPSEHAGHIQELSDSIAVLIKEIATIRDLNSVVIEDQQEVTIIYRVRKGDCVSRIAEFFYNDWSLYRKIEQDNNLQQPYILQVGQPLLIKIRTD